MAGLRDLDLGPAGPLPARLLSVRFARSGGPGGQNVNKVETKVDLRLDMAGASELLGEDAVSRLRAKLANRLDATGNLQIVSSEHREQGRNLDAALERMEAMIMAALARPKRRKPTRPSRASNERRLTEKKKRSAVKKQRGSLE